MRSTLRSCPTCRSFDRTTGNPDAVPWMVTPPVEVETPLGLGFRFIGAVYAEKRGLNEGEGAARP